MFLAGTKTVLTDGAGAAKHLTDDPACAISAVDEREHDAFIKALPQGEQSVAAVGTVSGINYSKGRKTTITLYKSVQ